MSKYERNYEYVQARKRAQQTKPVNSAKHNVPVGYKLMTFFCALLLIIVGFFLLAAVFMTNGFRSQYRLVSLTQLAYSIFDNLQAEHITWQGA